MRLGARTDVGPPPRFITSEPRLGFGAWAVGGRSWGAAGDAAEHEATVRRALEQLLTLQEEGKALAIGLCNATHLQIARATELAPLVSYQGPYNLFDRDAEQRELPLARERGLAFLAYRPLASGLLAGTYPRP